MFPANSTPQLSKEDFLQGPNQISSGKSTIDQSLLRICLGLPAGGNSHIVGILKLAGKQIVPFSSKKAGTYKKSKHSRKDKYYKRISSKD